MNIQDRLDEIAVIIEYFDTIVPYMIECDPYDYSVSTTYSIKFKKQKILPKMNEVKSLTKVLESTKGSYENELLITEFIVILDKIRRELNED